MASSLVWKHGIILNFEWQQTGKLNNTFVKHQYINVLTQLSYRKLAISQILSDNKQMGNREKTVLSWL